VLQQAANQPDMPLSHQYDQSQDREYQPRPPVAARVPTPIPLIMCMDAAVGLLNHLSTHQHSRQIILRRRIAEDILLPMVMEADTIDCPPEQFLCEFFRPVLKNLCCQSSLSGCIAAFHAASANQRGPMSLDALSPSCLSLSPGVVYALVRSCLLLPAGTLAGAVEVLIKLIWDEESPPFLPHNSVLHTIVWTLVCALDGVMWAGITWSPLSRVQALSKLSAVDDIKVIGRDSACTYAHFSSERGWVYAQMCEQNACEQQNFARDIFHSP